MAHGSVRTAGLHDDAADNAKRPSGDKSYALTGGSFKLIITAGPRARTPPLWESGLTPGGVGPPRPVLVSMFARGNTSGKKVAAVCYMNDPLPYAIEENHSGCFFDDDDDLAQVLQDQVGYHFLFPHHLTNMTKPYILTSLFMHPLQEILYQLIQGNNGSSSSRTHSTPSSSYGHDRTSNERKPSGVVNYDYELQLAVDEALARELQQMEGQLAKTSINDNNGRKPTSSSASGRGNSSTSRTPQVVEEDGIDPDNMTYEELQQLGEAIGSESKGLPESVIALLPTSTYKIRIFSRKEKHDE
ncbi:hypothetical protein BAE44_0021219, partial [Dichanthelium oligosanthes]